MKKLLLLFACIASLAFVSNEAQAAETYSADKVWTVTFTSELNPDSITNETIYIKDENGMKLNNIQLTLDGTKKRLTIDALADYKPGQYTLYITDKVKSKRGKYLKQTTTKVFTIAQAAPLSFINMKELTDNEKQLVENWANYYNEVVGPSTNLTGGEAVYHVGQDLYVVTAGFKPTGGYSIRLQKTEETSEAFTMHFEASVPVPEQMVTDAITFPYLIVKGATQLNLKFFLDEQLLDIQTVPVYTPALTALDLKREFVMISNRSSATVDLTGWTLVSTIGDQRFTFPSGYTLDAWSDVFILSGLNNFYVTNPHFYWTTENMWNNNGDTAQLYNANGVLINEISLP